MLPGPRLSDRTEYRTVMASPAISLVEQTAQPLDNTRLWNLMHATRHLRCSEILDKVYALLGVTAAGNTEIIPDYAVTPRSLLNRILKNEHNIRHPEGLQEVLDQCRRLTELLGEDMDAMFAFERQETRFAKQPTDADMAAFPFSFENSSVTLWWASFHGHRGVEVLLFESGTVDGSASLCSAVRDGREAVVKLLLDTGPVNANMKYDKGGRTALLFAAMDGRQIVVDFLIYDGRANVAAIDSLGETVLWWAVSKKWATIVKRLLNTGKVDIFINQKSGAFSTTPFMEAANAGHVEVANLLLETGKVDVNMKDDWVCCLRSDVVGYSVDENVHPTPQERSVALSDAQALGARIHEPSPPSSTLGIRFCGTSSTSTKMACHGPSGPKY